MEGRCVGDDSVGFVERVGVIGTGGDRDDLEAVGSGAGDVEWGVADDRCLLARVGILGGAGSGSRDRPEQLALLGIGAEGTLTEREVVADPGARELEASDRFVVTGQQ